MQQYQARVATLFAEAELDLRQRLRSASDVDAIEIAARGMADRLAVRLVETLLTGADQVISSRLPRSWRCIGYRTRLLLTTVGPLRLKRRLYRDGKGRFRFPLDEELGLAQQIRMTPRLQEVAVELCSRVPFRVGAGLLRKVLPAAPSPAALHRLVAAVGDRRQHETDRQRRAMFAEAEVGSGERRVSRLFVEADSKWIHLQQTPGHRNTEVLFALAHEGWESEGGPRWRLKEKQVHLELAGGDQFWESFTAQLSRRYDLRAAQVVVNGDGADWVQSGPRYFHRATSQLDRFHLARALRRVLVGPAWRRAYVAACRGELLPVVREVIRQGHPDGPEVIRYLESNRTALQDYRLRPGFADSGLRGLGAAEANVDKVIANRMSKRGMAWTRTGARRMAKVLEASHNGVLHDYLARPTARPHGRQLRRFLQQRPAGRPSGDSAENALRRSWPDFASRVGFGSVLRRIGRPHTLWEQN